MLAHGGSRDSTTARRLWLAALDAEAMLEDDSARVLLERARDADPAFFPAQAEYLTFLRDRGEFAAIRRVFGTADPRGGVVTECLAMAIAARFGRGNGMWEPRPEALAALRALASRDGSGCAVSYLGQLSPGGPGHTHAPAITWLWRGVALAPELESEWERLADALAAPSIGQPQRADSVLEAGARRLPHPLQRAMIYAKLVDLRGGRATPGGRRTAVQLAAALARDGRPMMRVMALDSLPLPERARRTLALYGAAGNWFERWATFRGLGKSYIDEGRPALALAPLDSAVAIADSVRRPWVQLIALMLRGRAESKTGRTADAEGDLRAAIAAGPAAGDPYYLAEAWHNLGHTYEAAGRWAEAAAAMDSFVAITRPIRWEPLRMISLHDAGTVRWEAGWHAGAERDFAEMVRVIDEQGDNYYWAGEYCERAGDLSRARSYYRTAYFHSSPPLSDPQAAAGLMRVFESLGEDDSAARMAEAHDSLLPVWTPLEHPLLPGFLARHGRVRKALALARAWADRQLRGGNVEGAALTTLDLGNLALGSAAPADALAAAQRAESLAAFLHVVGDVIAARQLQGEARMALGDRSRGLAVLQNAAALATKHPTADGLFSTQVALGDARAASGRSSEALRAYDRAARDADAVTAGLDIDLDRVQYRDRHLRPFDGAIRVLLAGPASAARTDGTLRWSERRKAAALTLALGAPRGRESSPIASFPAARDLKRRLSPRDALIDYLVVDSRISAIVVTDRGASITRLPIAVDSADRLARRLRRPFVSAPGGRVDLARAEFDVDAAAALYDGLVRPLERVLGARDRLAIVPDGPLYAVPFAALVTTRAARPDDYAGAQYLLDRVELRYLPAAQFLAPVARGDAARVLAVDGDAPGSDREIAVIRAALAPGSVRVLAGAAATESAVRAVAPGYDIVHFAAHAEASDRDPLSSHLQLGADGANDGYLHLSEIAAARWPVRLVVLSACATLQGPLYRGEGLMGLARAFLGAGAQGVVATQWPVGATTADLMGHFYQGFGSGATAPTALRSAQLALRRNPKTAHPFYWAGFVLVEGHQPLP